jgi:hypothetical protein
MKKETLFAHKIADTCYIIFTFHFSYIKVISVAVVRKRTIPTERPLLVGEVNANCCGERVYQRIPTVVNLGFLGRVSYTPRIYRCSFFRLIRRPEHLIGRHCYLPANWRSFIWWSPDQCVSHCYAIVCDRNFYCALFCVFMTHVSKCSISLRAEHPLFIYIYIHM